MWYGRSTPPRDDEKRAERLAELPIRREQRLARLRPLLPRDRSVA
jgi:hypothetical protein